MIDLTPIEIRKKKGDFPRAVRGYERAEVELFLDLVADRLEELVNDKMRLEERLRHIEEQLRQYRDREQALTEALVSAQELREDVRRQATKESDLLRREAEADAERTRLAAARAREQEEEVLRRLRARRAQLIHSYRTFLERELAELAVLADAAEKAEDPAAVRGRAAARGATAGSSAASKPVRPAEKLAPAAHEGS